jgi:hypothetical protein
MSGNPTLWKETAAGEGRAVIAGKQIFIASEGQTQ